VEDPIGAAYVKAKRASIDRKIFMIGEKNKKKRIERQNNWQKITALE
jgi:hypothetical protein